MCTPLQRLRNLVSNLGPGLVAGASDNDPTSVATLSVIGSATAYGLLWLLVLILPMLLSIQVISSRVGLVTGRSLQRVILTRFGRFWAMVSLLFVVAVDVVTIAADLEGGAAALSILLGRSWQTYVLPLAVLSAVLLVLGRYRGVQRYLRFVLFVFVAYIGAGLLAHPDWGEVLRSTFVPSFELTAEYVAGALALLGTTLTSYVYFWETIEEEEERFPRLRLRAVQTDAAIGIVFTTIIFWFILVTSASTVGKAGVRVQTAQEAAQTLAPLAGIYAEGLFALGLLASSLLALPVLAATTAYVSVQSFNRRGSIEEPISPETKWFYLVIVLSLATGAGVSYLGIQPIQLLFLASIVRGLGTPLLLILLLKAAADELVMGEYRVRGLLGIAGWFTAVVVSLAAVVYIAFQLWP